MIPDRLVGSCFMMGFHGRTVTPALQELIEELHVSAFVLYDARNIGSVRQLAALARSVDAACRRASATRALLAVDNEGGLNSQLLRVGTCFPGNLALAAGGGPADAEREARGIGAEVRAAGLHLNLAPVLDLYDPGNPGIGARSFGSDPAAVSRFGEAYLRGLARGGALGAAKHFPGNSETDTDPHAGLPVVRKSAARLWREDLRPYRFLARRLDAVLTSHALYPALDARHPATLSPRIMTSLLRRRLRFRGVVISDDLEMAAIERRYGLEGAVERAVRAGVDLVMVCHTPDKMRRAVRHLHALAARDASVARRVLESSGRVARLKARLRGGPRRAALRTAAHRRLAEELARRAVTIVRDEDGLLPLRRSAIARLGVIDPLHTMYGWNQPVRLGDAFRRRRRGVRSVSFDPRRPGPSVRAALALAGASDAVVAGTYDARFSPPQAALVRRLAGAGVPLAVLATRGPSDLAAFPRVRTYAACYNFYDVSLRAAADVMLGLAPAAGRLPVGIG